MFQIKRLIDLSDSLRSKAISDLKEVFFLTSSKQKFVSDAEREQFFNHWTAYYLQQQPQFTYLAFDEHDSLSGYLTGCRESLTAIEFIQHGSLKLFSDLFEDYPAHFHINCHPRTQGRGIGTQLVNTFLDDLLQLSVRGVHIVTSPHAQNVNFYKRNGFHFTEERHLGEAPLLFMGRKL